MKKAIVNEVKPVGEPRQGQYGMMYTYGIRFSNGDSGLYTSKSENQDKFVVGQEAYYTDEAKQSKTGKTWFKIKPANPDYDGQVSQSSVSSSSAPMTTTSKDELIARQTALKASAELGGTPDEVIKNAITFSDWVLGKSPQPVDHFPDKEKVKVTEEVAEVGAGDDLPF